MPIKSDQNPIIALNHKINQLKEQIETIQESKHLVTQTIDVLSNKPLLAEELLLPFGQVAFFKGGFVDFDNWLVKLNDYYVKTTNVQAINLLKRRLEDYQEKFDKTDKVYNNVCELLKSVKNTQYNEEGLEIMNIKEEIEEESQHDDKNPKGLKEMIKIPQKTDMEKEEDRMFLARIDELCLKEEENEEEDLTQEQIIKLLGKNKEETTKKDELCMKEEENKKKDLTQEQTIKLLAKNKEKTTNKKKSVSFSKEVKKEDGNIRNEKNIKSSGEEGIDKKLNKKREEISNEIVKTKIKEKEIESNHNNDEGIEFTAIKNAYREHKQNLKASNNFYSNDELNSNGDSTLQAQTAPKLSKFKLAMIQKRLSKDQE